MAQPARVEVQGGSARPGPPEVSRRRRRTVRRALHASWLPLVAGPAVVLAGVGGVIAFRAANAGPEPEHKNWWLVAELVLALGYVTSGLLLLSRRFKRLLGAA